MKRTNVMAAKLTMCFAAALVSGLALAGPPPALAQQGVRVIFERILMIDDSDHLSDAEMCFNLWANHGSPNGRGTVFSRRMGSGNSYTVNHTVQIFNAPNELILHADGKDDDTSALFGIVDRECVGSPAPPSLSINSSTNYASTKLNLAQFPGTNATHRFMMPSKSGGGVKFTVYGRIEVTRAPTTAAVTGKRINRVLDDPGVLTTIPASRTVKSIGKKGFYGNFMTTTSNGGNFEMKLSWDGNDRVTGTFSGNGSTGTIAGTLFGKVLIFKWSQDGGKYSGSGKFVMAADGKTFTGTYSNSLKDPEDGSAGAWNGRRL